MSQRTYTTIDKTDWPRGPWDDEPDKVQWADDPTGLDCLIVRNGNGALCGYVGVPPGHPWHKVGYSGHIDDVPCTDDYCYAEGHTPEATVEVHGGLTYSDSGEGRPEAEGICHVPEPGRPEDVWWFGFDCDHAFDLAPGHVARSRALGIPPIVDDATYRDLAYVKAECASLARQLAEVSA